MKGNAFKKYLKKIRELGTFYISEQTSKHLESVRLFELDVAINLLPPNGRLLEIGAGTGWQAQALHDRGYDVSAIDISSSNLRDNRIWSVTDYDGYTIPFENDTFDIVFSSNVLEHIPHIYDFQKEIQRVVKADGLVMHIIPSSGWRFWSNCTEILKQWRLPLVHGEHAGNAFVEVFYFSRWSWSRMFRKTGWVIKSIQSIGLFYTGSSIMDSRLSMQMRKNLSKVLGSACNVFILRNYTE